MADREARLGILASKILEGTKVDWGSAESSARADDRDVLRELRIVEEIAALHRNLSPTKTPRSITEAGVDETAAPAWTWGHLRVLDRVGQGAFGEVYRAWDTQLDREVALKLLRTPEVARDPLQSSLSDPSRVVDEGRLLARVRHANVITVHGAERRDGQVGLWMEFIRGRTLDQIVQQNGPLGAREATLIGLDLCRALSAVHGAGLLHRDLSARNVMREDGGRIVLMDFGSGREIERAALGAVAATPPDLAGTPLYLAPEIFEGRPADARSEIYCAGVLLYYLVAGSYPVSGRSVRDVRDAHRQGTRTLLRDVRSDLPQAFVQVVERALAPDPERRHQSIGALEAALGELLPTTTAAVKRAPLEKQALLLTAAAAAIVVAAIVAWTVARDSGAPAGTPPAQAAAALAAITVRPVSPRASLSTVSNPSRDGRYVTYMDGESGDVALWDLVAGKGRRLYAKAGGWDDPEYVSFSALSLDARRVALDWHRGEPATLRIIDTDGRNTRTLIDNRTYMDVWPHEWSQDGSLVLALLIERDGTNVIALVAASDGAVRVLKKLGTIMPERMSLSPDSRYVVYDYAGDAGAHIRDIFLIDTHTGAERRLVDHAADDRFPMWTPDGRQVAFTSTRAVSADLWLLPIANGMPQSEPRLVKGDMGSTWPRGFDEKGAYYYDSQVGLVDNYLATLNLESSTPIGPAAPVSPQFTGSNLHPRWSPDGRYVAYVSRRSAADVRRTLWLLDTTTGRERELAPTLRAGGPVWLPNGRALVVRGSDERGRQGYFVVDLETGRPALAAETTDAALMYFAVTADGRAVVHPRGEREIVTRELFTNVVTRRFDGSAPGIRAFTVTRRDGDFVIYLKNTGHIAVRKLLTGQEWEWFDGSVTSLPIGAAGPLTSPDRRSVAFVANSTRQSIKESTLRVWDGAGSARQLVSVQAPEVLRVQSWTPDGRFVFFTRQIEDPDSTKRRETLWRVAVTGGEPVSLGLTMEGLRDVSVNPDGRRIVFTAGWPVTELWTLENFLSQPATLTR